MTFQSVSPTNKRGPVYTWEMSGEYGCIPDDEMKQLKKKMEKMYEKFDDFSIDGDSDGNVFHGAGYTEEIITLGVQNERFKIIATKYKNVIKDVVITVL